MEHQRASTLKEPTKHDQVRARFACFMSLSFQRKQRCCEQTSVILIILSPQDSPKKVKFLFVNPEYQPLHKIDQRGFV